MMGCVNEKPVEARVLVVDDEPNILELLSVSLRFQGFEVATASTGAEGLDTARTFRPDAVILDVMMPGMDGFGLLKRLRADGVDAPVLFLTAKDAVEDKISGLTLGADDYVTKPFSLRELTARVRAVLRRSATVEERLPSGYQGAQLNADFEAVAVSVDGSSVRLTRREFELLRYLVQNRNRVISRDRLLERVWGYDRLVETRSVDVHVGRLRNKLGMAGRQIETVVGLGYRFVD
jgi:two-component system, OmpR family, response regulator